MHDTDNKGKAGVGGGEEEEVCGNFLYFLFKFYVNLKLLFKKLSILRKKNKKPTTFIQPFGMANSYFPEYLYKHRVFFSVPLIAELLSIWFHITLNLFLILLLLL